MSSIRKDHLRIVYVTDNFDADNNGTTISVRRFVETLRSFGHEVRVVSNGREEPDKYVVPSYTKGFIPWYVKRECMVFAKPDKEVIRKAFEGADVIYFQLPFILGLTALKIANEMHIPVTAGFHCQPENITFNIGLGWCTPLSELIYELFKNMFYKKIGHIHCPTQFLADELKRHHYKGQTHVISNGSYMKKYHPMNIERDPQLQGKFVILMSGRLSTEKRQDLLIHAVEKSKYKNQIQIILAGMGPLQSRYEKMSANLPNKPIIRLFSQEELVYTINMCDLYVHGADAEIESISCIEAFSCGLVPVIANAKKSATKQFALCEYNTFKGGNVDELVERIEFWMEHEELRKEYSAKYVEFAKEFDIVTCGHKMENMFYEAMDDYYQMNPEYIQNNISIPQTNEVKQPIEEGSPLQVLLLSS
ncbi:hypothetical protein WA158_008365 [Blastocystis sp. Blastoise]